MTTTLITKPGVYPDVPEADYHADPVAGGSLSSTGARTLATRTPAHYLHQRTHGRKDTASFDLGRVAHGQVLGVGGELHEVHADDWRTKAAREERDDARAAGHTPLLAKDADRVRLLVDAIRTHPIAGPLFARDGTPELTVVARDPESGVTCRARLDWLVDVAPGQRLIAVDLKTTTRADTASFSRSSAEYGYVQQDPFYGDTLHWLGLTNDADGEPVDPLFVFVTVEVDPPHLVAVHRILAEDRDRGRELNRYARDRYRECTASGVWPGYEPVVHDLPLPGWWRAQHDAASAARRYATAADLLADELEQVDEQLEDQGDDTAAPVAPPPVDVEAPSSPSGVEVDQVWTHKRGARRLTVTGVEGDRIDVRRSSSRRTQAVRLSTLRKDYRLETAP